MKEARARKGIFGCLLVFAGVAGCLFTVHLDLNFTIRTLRHSAPIQQETCSRHSLFCSFIIVRWHQVSHVFLQQRKNMRRGCSIHRVRERVSCQIYFYSWRLRWCTWKVYRVNEDAYTVLGPSGPGVWYLCYVNYVTHELFPFKPYIQICRTLYRVFSFCLTALSKKNWCL